MLAQNPPYQSSRQIRTRLVKSLALEDEAPIYRIKLILSLKWRFRITLTLSHRLSLSRKEVSGIPCHFTTRLCCS